MRRSRSTSKCGLVTASAGLRTHSLPEWAQRYRELVEPVRAARTFGLSELDQRCVDRLQQHKELGRTERDERHRRRALPFPSGRRWTSPWAGASDLVAQLGVNVSSASAPALHAPDRAIFTCRLPTQ